MKTPLTTLLLVFSLLSASVASAQEPKEAEAALSVEPRNFRLATFANAGTMEWAPLKVGVPVYARSDRYQWDRVPDAMRGVRFLVSPLHAGVLKFEVASGGLVYLVTSTRWDGGGNSGGEWKEEVLLEKDLRRKGWKRLQAFKNLSTTDTGEMAVFYRHCEAGEKHSIRTEKYVAPMLLIR